MLGFKFCFSPTKCPNLILINKSFTLYIVFLLLLRITKPIIAETTDASSTLIFEAAIGSGFSKARLVIKMLIVKPIPPSADMPAMWRQFKPEERDASFVLTATKEVRKIPINFPIMRPAIIPMELGVARLFIMSEGKTIAVLARAKSGSIIKAIG